ncbi:hypothetical protein [Mucilaginibacter sp. CSA2-8R]|uniref:hypothetical protein n=1 Tax=Mucilaginibacter sp. CSA2-8R TaxID=3141542 RepID=UPI00315D75DD
MCLFYKVPLKQLQQDRKDIFVNIGIPALERNGFQKSPFPVDWFGRNNVGSYDYTLYRLNVQGHLEMIRTQVSRGDRWIKVFLNIFDVKPRLESLDKLKSEDGLQFHLLPNSFTRMQLRSDDFKGMPLFNTVQHKLKSYYTKRGYQRSISRLSKLIEKDMKNIDRSVNRWHELHQPLVTGWDGKKLDCTV